jgi:hypothetical protein
LKKILFILFIFFNNSCQSQPVFYTFVDNLSQGYWSSKLFFPESNEEGRISVPHLINSRLIVELPVEKIKNLNTLIDLQDVKYIDCLKIYIDISSRNEISADATTLEISNCVLYDNPRDGRLSKFKAISFSNEDLTTSISSLKKKEAGFYFIKFKLGKPEQVILSNEESEPASDDCLYSLVCFVNKGLPGYCDEDLKFQTATKNLQGQSAGYTGFCIYTFHLLMDESECATAQDILSGKNIYEFISFLKDIKPNNYFIKTLSITEPILQNPLSSTNEAINPDFIKSMCRIEPQDSTRETSFKVVSWVYSMANTSGYNLDGNNDLSMYQKTLDGTAKHLCSSITTVCKLLHTILSIQARCINCFSQDYETKGKRTLDSHVILEVLDNHANSSEEETFLIDPTFNSYYVCTVCNLHLGVNQLIECLNKEHQITHRYNIIHTQPYSCATKLTLENYYIHYTQLFKYFESFETLKSESGKFFPRLHLD